MQYTKEAYKPLFDIIQLINNFLNEKRNVYVSDLYYLKLHLENPISYQIVGSVSVRIEMNETIEDNSLSTRLARLTFDKKGFEYYLCYFDTRYNRMNVHRELKLSDTQTPEIIVRLKEAFIDISNLIENQNCKIFITSEKLYLKMVK